VATLSRLWPEASTLVTLRTAIHLGKLLTILNSLAPTSSRAGLVTCSAIPLRFRKSVHVKVFGVGAGDDLLPVDGFDVAQVVIV